MFLKIILIYDKISENRHITEYYTTENIFKIILGIVGYLLNLCSSIRFCIIWFI